MEIKWLEVRPGKIRSTMKERGRSQVTEGLGRARGATEHLAERIRIRAALGSSPGSPRRTDFKRRGGRKAVAVIRKEMMRA